MEKEKKYLTLKDFLQFLFLYDEITDQAKKVNPDDPKLISMLPILVKIGETLLDYKNPHKDNDLGPFKY